MTSAREEILDRIRTAAKGAPDGEIPRNYQRGDAGRTPEEILDLFVERVEDYKADVRRVAAADLAATIASVFSDAGVTRIVVPDDLPAEWTSHVQAEVLRDSVANPVLKANLDNTGGVVTGCAVGVAEPGTIILDGTARQGRRAITLLPDWHVCVITPDKIVNSLPQAMDQLGNTTTPMTWIAGPSATSDIELARVEGVHGPRNLVVLVVTN